MKKITVIFLLFTLSLPLFGCRGIIDRIKPAATEEQSVTEPETETETETETEEVVQYTADQLYELCKAAYNKTLSYKDVCMKTALYEVIYLTYGGGRKLFVKLNTESDVKIKSVSEEGAAAEIHQLTNTETNGEPKSVKTDMFIDKDRIYYRENDETDYIGIDKNSEQAAALMPDIEKAVSAENDIVKEEFDQAEIKENTDGSKTVTVTLDPEKMKELVDKRSEDFKLYFEALGGTDVKIEVRSMTCVYTVSDKGEFIREKDEVEYGVTMTQGVTDVTASVKADVAVDFLNIGQSFDIEFPSVPEVYALYNPYIAETANKSTLKLRENGTFEMYCDMYNNAMGLNVRNIVTAHGNYTYGDDGTRVTCELKTFTLKLLFDSYTEKYTFKSYLESFASMNPENGKLYDVILKSLTDEGYEGTLEEWNKLSGTDSFGAEVGNMNGELIIDKDTMTAYVMLKGITLEENEYYIASEELCLTLNGDGTCTLRGEYTDKEDDLGEYTMSYLETGTYEQSDLSVTCKITKKNTKLRFKDASSEKSYKDMYTEAYDNGYIARVEYEYYMDLVLQDGYTGDTDDTYKMTLEPHTKTAVIVDYPESDM